MLIQYLKNVNQRFLKKIKDVYRKNIDHVLEMLIQYFKNVNQAFKKLNVYRKNAEDVLKNVKFVF